MESTSGLTLLIVAANVLFSWKGFKDSVFFERYVFDVDKILIGKEYKRLIASGFLHLGWIHLLFNMFSLSAFNTGVELQLGHLEFLTVYFASLIGGNLFALYIHRHHGDYSAAGASGAVCGVMFASIALFPGMHVGFFGIGFSLPGWLFGIAYILFSIYGIKSKTGNIGHEAHFGGAIIGMVAAIAFYPAALVENFWVILLLLLPSLLFIFLVIKRPEYLLIEGYSSSGKYHNVEDRYNIEKSKRQQEMDAILEKINQKGMAGLSKKEREKLDEFSKRK